MKKLTLVLAALLLAFCFHPARAGAQAPPGPIPPVAQQPSADTSQPPAPSAAQQVSPLKITAYTLPPDLYKKTERLSKIRLGFIIGGTIYGLIALWLILRLKVAPKYRGWAERASSNLFVQVLVFAPLLILTIDALELPENIYGHIVSRSYGLSVQGWGSWAWDWTKGEFVSVIIGIIGIAILYAAIRKSPRRWWFYFWLASLPLLAALVFLQPLVIDPLFHKFEPLAQKDPALAASLEQMVQRAGENIPTERMYLMGEAVKGTDLNAYVTGFGASKRMVVYDTTVAKMTTPEIVLTMGHETGHYVLNHIPKGLAIGAIGLFITFYVGFRLLGGMLARWGGAWGIRGVDDLASLPALLILLSIISFIGSPVSNAISRYLEHQADQYAIEVTHGLIPDTGQVAAQGFQVLGETDLEYPDPSPLNVLMTYDHPPARDRVHFFLTYDPWSSGGTGEFVH
ncbi:MAG: M48 family metallopeptidase [Candidatus Acidiferrales bacterium]